MFLKKALTVSVLGLSLAVTGLVGEVTHAQATNSTSKAPEVSVVKVNYNSYQGLYKSDKIPTPAGAKYLNLSNSVEGNHFAFKFSSGNTPVPVVGEAKVFGKQGSVKYTETETGKKIGTGKLTLIKNGMILTFTPDRKAPEKAPKLPSTLVFHKLDVRY